MAVARLGVLRVVVGIGAARDDADRLMVLIPVFLIAGPGLIGVHNLGGGIVVGILSGAIGLRRPACWACSGGRQRGRVSGG